MPTPVGIARQCLTQEASSALDEAVAVARRRSHSQTTSLHLISAFLSFPTSSLRDACSRVRSSAYAPRFQFKALELCFGSALDRLPSSQQSSNNESDPPISNSLMAAIKRSQAHQRRNPESFHLYQQQQQNSSLNCVKVEVQQLVLSILDDPVVSRVFAEAGFRSCDIKIAILRPLPPLSRLQRSRRAPLFLCNLTQGGDSDFAARNFNFPFLGFPESSEGDENFRRIGQVLARKKERNPLLVGVYANQALRSFSEIVQRGRAGSVPAELSGMSLLCIEKEIHKFISEGGSEGLSSLGAKFEELHHLIGNCCGPGVVLSFGDLSVLLDDNSIDSVGYVISQLSKFSELHRQKLWLMGAVASYEMYLKFLMMFPSIEKDWDLQILPITSLKTTTPPLGGFQSRPQSLMESFVPFGGFFSTTSDMSSPFTSTYQPISRCHLCNEKYEQEVSAFSNGGCTPSVADQYNASLPSWLQKGELNASKGFDMTQAKDDGTVFNAKVTGLQKKWNDICRRLHHCPAITKDDYRVRPQVVSGAMGFPFLSDRKDDANSLSSSSDIRAVPNKNDCENAQPSTSIESHKISSPTQKTPEPLVSEAKSENFSSKTMRTECSRTENPRFPPFPFPSVNSSCDNPSPSTTIPVTTDLGLGTLYASTCKEPVKLTQTDKDWLQKSPEKVDVARPNISNPSIQSPSCSGAEQVDPHDVKSLWRCLMDKVGRQNEAIHTISQTISRCRTGNERRRGASLKRDVWFSFIGLDRVVKRRTVLALAEVVFGRKQNVISVDLSSQDGLTHSNTVFGCREVNGDDAKFRGKMVVDYIAEEISKKPLSIVFLENINKADMLLQNSLSLAIKTGKFSDSHGREVSVNNTIFVATSSAAKDTTSPSVEENTCTKYSEERILKAQNLEMQILIGNINGDDNIKMKFSNVLVTSKKETCIPSFLNKRKLVEGSDTRDWLGRAKKTPKCLDLNLPVNETETIDLEYDSSESDAVSENSEMWLEEFLAQMDGSVMFKPFDFDTLANTLLKEINAVVRSTIGPDCVVEIDSEVMEQILAASWLSDRERAVEDWVQQILGRSFIEAQQRYAFTSQSVLKLVTCDDQYVRDQAHGVCLPSRIIVNL